MSKSLIVVCERYDKIRSRFEEAGWDAWSLDILPSKNPKAKHIQDDAIHYFQTTTKKFAMIIDIDGFEVAVISKKDFQDLLNFTITINSHGAEL